MCSPRGLTWLGVSGSAEAFTEDARRPGRGSRLGDRGGGLWTNFEGPRCGAGPASRAGLGFGPGTAASGGSESPQRTGASVSRLGVGRMLVCGKQGRSSGLGCLSEVSSPAQTREEGPGCRRSNRRTNALRASERRCWKQGAAALAGRGDSREETARQEAVTLGLGSPWGWGHRGGQQGVQSLGPPCRDRVASCLTKPEGRRMWGTELQALRGAREEPRAAHWVAAHASLQGLSS